MPAPTRELRFFCALRDPGPRHPLCPCRACSWAPAPPFALTTKENPQISDHQDTHIDISPRHLASTEGPGPVLQALAEDGWLRHDVAHLDQTFLATPDQRFRLGLGQLDPGAWWRLAAAREPLTVPQWQAGFSTDTPPELIVAVTDQLRYHGHQIDWTGEAHPALADDPFDPDAITTLLLTAGWRIQDVKAPGRLEVQSPDALARASLVRDADPLDLMGYPALAVEAGPRDAGIPYWQALFTTATPSRVALAFTQALTDPAPLRRNPDWLDERLLEHLADHKPPRQPGTGPVVRIPSAAQVRRRRGLR